jgi:hypothetical protein
LRSIKLQFNVVLMQTRLKQGHSLFCALGDKIIVLVDEHPSSI